MRQRGMLAVSVVKNEDGLTLRAGRNGEGGLRPKSFEFSRIIRIPGDLTRECLVLYKPPSGRIAVSCEIGRSAQSRI